MAKINLLPWRQELRKQRQQEFIAILMGVVMVAVALVLAGHMALSKQVSDQEERNTYIQSEIQKLDGQIQEIDALQKRREELLSRMKVIQDLQGRRPVIVRIFDELVRVMPEGTHLVSLERRGDSFSITGVAESANQVSALMRNLEASPWFRNPALSTVATTSAAPRPANSDEKALGNSFSMSVSLEQPDLAAAGQKEAPK
ncbi:MAG: PilN domain-containing protein [Pseudomonadota bacterium]